MLKDLTEEEIPKMLLEVGISAWGHRRKIIQKIKELKERNRNEEQDNVAEAMADGENSQEIILDCPFCDDQFNDKVSLKRHLTEEHAAIDNSAQHISFIAGPGS